MKENLITGYLCGLAVFVNVVDGMYIYILFSHLHLQSRDTRLSVTDAPFKAEYTFYQIHLFSDVV